jgi:hypothetical protein
MILKKELEDILKSFNNVGKFGVRRGHAYRFRSNGSQILVYRDPKSSGYGFSRVDKTYAMIIFKNRQNETVSFGEFYDALIPKEQENFIYHFDIFSKA